MAYLEELRNTAKAFGVNVSNKSMDQIDLLREIAKTLGVELGTEHKNSAELLAIINKVLPNALGDKLYNEIINKQGWIILTGDTITESFVESNSNIMGAYIPKATVIEQNILAYTNITSVILSNAITIKAYAFSGCANLTDVVLPETLTSMENEVFLGCTSLTNIVLPESLTSIGDDIFSACENLQSVIVKGSNVSHVGANIFADAPNAKLYVSDDLVDSFKAISNLSQYSDRIRPLSEYAG